MREAAGPLEEWAAHHWRLDSPPTSGLKLIRHGKQIQAHVHIVDVKRRDSAQTEHAAPPCSRQRAGPVPVAAMQRRPLQDCDPPDAGGGETEGDGVQAGVVRDDGAMVRLLPGHRRDRRRPSRKRGDSPRGELPVGPIGLSPAVGGLELSHGIRLHVVEPAKLEVTTPSVVEVVHCLLVLLHVSPPGCDESGDTRQRIDQHAPPALDWHPSQGERGEEGGGEGREIGDGVVMSDSAAFDSPQDEVLKLVLQSESDANWPGTHSTTTTSVRRGKLSVEWAVHVRHRAHGSKSPRRLTI
mmetsp:Transcript_65831/g.143700  ORF Transcript_65831/g.143700 Transcript_65831/m.143700 type:complete len:297 (+) Transcript_65831:243-1133(+)